MKSRVSLTMALLLLAPSACSSNATDPVDATEPGERDIEHAQAAARGSRSALFYALTGSWDVAQRFVSSSGQSVEVLRAEVESVPPLVDTSYMEIEAIAAEPDSLALGRFEVPLRDAAGRAILHVTFEWHPVPDRGRAIPAVEITLLSVERSQSVASVIQREPDSQGRLPREQFIGSAGLRMERIFNALPDRFTGLDVGPRNIREAAWQFNYADADIYNGSLHQFYSNSTGNFADDFPAFADQIGAHEKADAVREANRLFAGVDLRDRTARNRRLDDFSDRDEEILDEQTERYCDAEESALDLLVAFVEANPDQFLY